MSVLMRVATGAVVLGTAAYVLDKSIYTVPGGHRAVIWDRFRGILDRVVPEGTHFRIPGLQNPHILDVRTRPLVIATVTGTKDLQTVNLQLRVLSRPSIDHLPKIFKSLGPDWEERVLPSLGNEVMKAVVAKYDADRLLSLREEVSRAVRDEINARAREFNIVLEDVSITHLTFGREFTDAIEAKQVAQQEAERSKFVVMKAEQEKKAAIITAEGESEAARLISDALARSGAGLIEIRRIEAARDIAASLARNPKVSYLPGATGGAGGSSNILLAVSTPSS